MTDKDTAGSVADAVAADAAKEAPKGAAVAKRDDGSVILDFNDYASAEAQAKALGKGASVEAIGVAYRVVKE